ncbi:uncharacterized protein [Ptychodera flava]|uniref:uncharacterized protein n=1 Tax=Ptychodera flava TaxID=63121 RepID=UPI00396A5350
MSEKNTLPGWMKWWFVASALIQTWDASFIWLRPHSLPGGKLHSLWKPYALYIDIDLRYGDLDDSFGLAQSLLNFAEVILLVVALIMNSQNHRCTTVTSFTVSTMTFWKTVLYFVMSTSLVNGSNMIGTSDPLKLIFLFLIPNGVWLLLPALSMISLGNRLAEPLENTQKSKKKQR